MHILHKAVNIYKCIKSFILRQNSGAMLRLGYKVSCQILDVVSDWAEKGELVFHINASDKEKKLYTTTTQQ